MIWGFHENLHFLRTLEEIWGEISNLRRFEESRQPWEITVFKNKKQEITKHLNFMFLYPKFYFCSWSNHGNIEKKLSNTNQQNYGTTLKQILQIDLLQQTRGDTKKIITQHFFNNFWNNWKLYQLGYKRIQFAQTYLYLMLPNLHMLIKQKKSLNSQKLGSHDFWQIANSVLN